jgi:hypothetical protein
VIQLRKENDFNILIKKKGEPTDDAGKVNVNQFKKVLLSRGTNVFTTVKKSFTFTFTISQGVFSNTRLYPGIGDSYLK